VVAIPDRGRAQRHGPRLPFHELPNVILTPHCSSATDGARDRRFGTVAANIDRFVRGEPLQNVALRT
jgi:phosphoglycerate dehydrogenase-like enzyme